MEQSGCSGAPTLARDLYNQQQVATVVLAPGPVDQYTAACLEDVAMSGGARSNYHPAREAVERGDFACAVRLSGFQGLLGRQTQPGITFQRELADRVRVIACPQEPVYICLLYTSDAADEL